MRNPWNPYNPTPELTGATTHSPAPWVLLARRHRCGECRDGGPKHVLIQRITRLMHGLEYRNPLIYVVGPPTRPAPRTTNPMLGAVMMFLPRKASARLHQDRRLRPANVRESEFPANRERYREFDEISVRKLETSDYKINKDRHVLTFLIKFNRVGTRQNRIRFSHIRESTGRDNDLFIFCAQ